MPAEPNLSFTIHYLQGYYNPHIISVIDKLISGSDLMARNEMLASFSESSEPEPTPQKPSAMMHGRSFRLDSRSGSQGDLNVPSFAGGPRPRLASEGSAGAGAEEVELSKLQGSCFYQIPLPGDMATRSYGSLYKRLSKKGIIPLGLLRGIVSTSASFSSKAAPAPYVYTNPTFDTELNAGDRVFILSVRPISDNIEEEQPVRENQYHSCFSFLHNTKLLSFLNLLACRIPSEHTRQESPITSQVRPRTEGWLALAQKT